MKAVQIRLIFLALVTVIGVSVYILFFGEVGWIVQQQLSDRLERLRQNVSSLERENSILQDRYYQLQSQSDQALLKERQESREVIILKFRMPLGSDVKPDANPETQTTPAIGLVEVRILYISGYFFLALVLLTLFERLYIKPRYQTEHFAAMHSQ
ncbi:MAG: hypothetical protein KDK39_07760 [Leptospiraceae bacterium]|nr:hypothetical protein [Planctomycetaceae bacterium]MCB1173443.1 hypothetical protein [Leptospiraceae bacterium]